jgi:hypothetical protein
MKKIIILLVAFSAVIAGAYFFVTEAVKKISYTYSFSGITLGNFKVSDFLNTNTGAMVTITMNVVINNLNNFSIPINYLYYEFYYKNNLLGKSADTKNNKMRIKIIANGKTGVNQNIDVFISQANLGILTDKLAKHESDYTVKIFANVFLFNVRLNNITFKA